MAMKKAGGSKRRRGSCLGRLAGAVAGLALAAGIAAGVYARVLRPWYLRWGATDDEVGRPLPGDEIVPRPSAQSTRAITIHAPAAEVWSWLVQVGQGRGGYYSYDWLENLFNCDIHSVDRIVPELQTLAVGDRIKMYRGEGGPPPFVVARVDPGHALVLASEDRATFSWAFVAEPVDAGNSRLLVRARVYAEPAWAAPFINVEPIHFVMEREMLRGIKCRAEKAVARRTARRE